jgi:hypothetical protein
MHVEMTNMIHVETIAMATRGREAANLFVVSTLVYSLVVLCCFVLFGCFSVTVCKALSGIYHGV